MLTNDSFNFNIWYESYDESFIKLNLDSFAQPEWLSFEEVMKREYSSSILKPINLYVQKLYPPPKLITIEDNKVRLRQGNHAEIFLAIEDGSFKNVDRPWIRQYYQTSQFPENVEGCFPGAYKFYVPWIIDANVQVSLEAVEESPFLIYPKTENWKKLDGNEHFIEPSMVAFNFKNSGSHMVDSQFGKIKRQSPMYDIVFDADAILVEKIREFYE